VRLFSLSGRSSRAPYFWHTLLDGFFVAVLILLIANGALAGMSFGGGMAWAWLAVLAAWTVVVAATVAALAITVRRLHDLDRTGWQCLLALVPLVNIYIWCLLLFQPGTHGANRYGPDPKA
jgi:uncharacterized membrane protein YhaH (DUF805 family)